MAIGRLPMGVFRNSVAFPSEYRAVAPWGRAGLRAMLSVCNISENATWVIVTGESRESCGVNASRGGGRLSIGAICSRRRGRRRGGRGVSSWRNQGSVVSVAHPFGKKQERRKDGAPRLHRVGR